MVKIVPFLRDSALTARVGDIVLPNEVSEQRGYNLPSRFVFRISNYDPFNTVVPEASRLCGDPDCRGHTAAIVLQRYSLRWYCSSAFSLVVIESCGHITSPFCDCFHDFLNANGLSVWNSTTTMARATMNQSPLRSSPTAPAAIRRPRAWYHSTTTTTLDDIFT